MHFTFTTYIGLSNKRIFSSLGKTLHIERVPSNRKKNRARELYTTQPPCTIINLTTYLFKEIRSTLLRRTQEAVASIEMRGAEVYLPLLIAGTQRYREDLYLKLIFRISKAVLRTASHEQNISYSSFIKFRPARVTRDY